MFTIAGDRLETQVLDPVAERERLGSRYCTGGYVHQVLDARHGPLLAGPQWPAARPDVFHGQGAPDSFNGFPGAESVPLGGEVGVLGVGLVRRASSEPFHPRDNREVTAFVAWETSSRVDLVAMSTEHSFGGFGYRLRKSVSVSGRIVRSETTLASTGSLPLPVRWFAHPFFPIPSTGRLFRANLAFGIPENPGFEKDRDGWICRRHDHDWTAGCFQQLVYDAGAAAALELEQAHPLVSGVIVRTDFAPTSFSIWGNDRTFSVEPYWEHTVAPGESATWAIEYIFGT